MHTTQMVLRFNQLQDLTISTCLHMYILYLIFDQYQAYYFFFTTMISKSFKGTVVQRTRPALDRDLLNLHLQSL